MAKPKTIYSCTECGGQTLKWQGQCPHCSAWNTLVESVAERTAARYQGLAQGSVVQVLGEVQAAEEPRRETGISELDRVLGGGLVQGGVVLLGGDPGIGKSTLLLQALARLSESCSVLYVSGEESVQQVAQELLSSPERIGSSNNRLPSRTLAWRTVLKFRSRLPSRHSTTMRWFARRSCARSRRPSKTRPNLKSPRRQWNWRNLVESNVS